jgi:hypothetical protein
VKGTGSVAVSTICVSQRITGNYVKFALEQATRAQRGEQWYGSTISLTSALEIILSA